MDENTTHRWLNYMYWLREKCFREDQRLSKMCKHSKWHNFSRIIYDVKGTLSYKYEWNLSTNVFALHFIEDYFFNLANYNIELGNKIIRRMLPFIFATLRETQTMKADFRMRKKKTRIPTCLFKYNFKNFKNPLKNFQLIYELPVYAPCLKTPISVEKFAFTFF